MSLASVLLLLLVTALCTVRGQSQLSAAWFVSGRDAAVACGSAATQGISAGKVLLPIKAVELLNSYAAVGLRTYDDGTNGEAGGASVLLTVDVLDKGATQCSALPPSLDVNTLQDAAVTRVRAQGSCAAFFCVIGGGSAATLCSTGHDQWTSGPPLPFRVSRHGVADTVNLETGGVELILVGGSRSSGPDTSVWTSKVDGTSCSLGPWTVSAPSSPIEAVDFVFAAPSSLQGGLFVLTGLDVGKMGATDLNVAYFDLYFVPLRNISNSSAWMLLSKGPYPAYWMVKHSVEPPVALAEVALNLALDIKSLAGETAAEIVSMALQWASASDDDSEFSAPIPALLMVVGRQAYLGSGLSITSGKQIAGQDLVLAQSVLHPIPSNGFTSSVPAMAAPILLRDTVRSGRPVFSAPTPVDVAGRLSFASGYLGTVCQDACPNGKFTLGCMVDPWDAQCFSCNECASGREFLVGPCGFGGGKRGYGDTQCQACTVCGAEAQETAACNTTYDTACRALPPVPGPQPLPDSAVPTSLLDGILALLVSACVTWVLSMCFLVSARDCGGGAVQSTARGTGATKTGAGLEASAERGAPSRSLSCAFYRVPCALVSLTLFEASRLALLLLLTTYLFRMEGGGGQVQGLTLLTMAALQLAVAWVVAYKLRGSFRTRGCAALLHSRALLMQTGASLRGDSAAALPHRAALLVAYASIAGSLAGDVLPAFLLLRFVVLYPTARVSVHAVAVAVLLLTAGSMGGFTGFKRVVKLHYVAKLKGTTALGEEEGEDVDGGFEAVRARDASPLVSSANPTRVRVQHHQGRAAVGSDAAPRVHRVASLLASTRAGATPLPSTVCADDTRPRPPIFDASSDDDKSGDGGSRDGGQSTSSSDLQQFVVVGTSNRLAAGVDIRDFFSRAGGGVCGLPLDAGLCVDRGGGSIGGAPAVLTSGSSDSSSSEEQDPGQDPGHDPFT